MHKDHVRTQSVLKGAQLNNSWKTPRIAAAAVLVACMVAAFAALGGVGQAQNGSSAAQSQYGKKVTICHKGKTIKVSKHAVRAHLRHGDTLGPCSTVKAKHKKHKKHHKHVAKPKHEHSAKVKNEEHTTKAKADAEKSKGDKPGNGKGRGK
jgi:hypothetical protein